MENEILRKRFLFAIDIAKEAARFLLNHENMKYDVSQKAENDYVTSADKATENIIEGRIKSSFPEDSILGEENGNIGLDRTKRWIIDPIDGTLDFMTGFPNYSISIAFQDEVGLAFGVVLVVRQNELFTAMRGEGAFLNGKQIHTDERLPLNKQIAILVPPHRHHELLDGYIRKMRRFYEIISDMRSIGSAACSLCYVACGRVDIYYEIGLKLYDCAAGIVILKEAGGKVTFITDDEDWIELAASSESTHNSMLEIINND